MNEIRKYIRLIRNPYKRQYAEQYFLYRFAYPEDDGTPPEPPVELGYMGAQAVRIRLQELLVNPSSSA